ncbi:MAG: transposase [Rubrobacteraceae bacterium]|nr:transposase [Rubrobacteraceae bacterium]MCL6438702.1 transposase [Rubrobacteraceae bacterium]
MSLEPLSPEEASTDEDFEELFEVRGRPAIAPWRLALVTVVQFSEELSDRQAAETVSALL